MKNKYLILTAQVISMLFSPFYFPVVAFIVLLIFSYMKLFPLGYKISLLAMVYLFTIVMPRLGIYVYRRINGWTRHQLGRRERRFVPYLLSIVSYACLLFLMQRMHMPRFTLSIIITALVLQIICALLNSFVKISTHSAAAAGVVGMLLAFSMLFAFDPTYWLCLTILMTGAVNSARLILRQHTLGQIEISNLVGFLCGLLTILLI